MNALAESASVSQDASLVLEVSDLRISIATDEGLARVLDHVDLRIPKGRIVGVVGESGCGKTTLVRAILGILPAAVRVEQGSIRLGGQDLLALSEHQMSRDIRGRSIGFVPQDPYLAFNPVFKVGRQLLEIMRWHSPEVAGGARLTRELRARHRQRLVELLEIVQIPDPANALERYPHQFSGGQRQRLLIAAALSCRPQLVIADEPTTALDVTTQAQILRLLRQLCAEFQMSMLFVTHDFGVVAQLCDEVCVMYAGQTVESGPVREVLARPRHPYTRMLIACHPDRSSALEGIPGTVPSPLAPPSGCRFHPRCPQAIDACASARPRPVRDGEHVVSCVLQDPAVPVMGASPAHE